MSVPIELDASPIFFGKPEEVWRQVSTPRSNVDPGKYPGIKRAKMKNVGAGPRACPRKGFIFQGRLSALSRNPITAFTKTEWMTYHKDDAIQPRMMAI
jgi:hypothetical protein